MHNLWGMVFFNYPRIGDKMLAIYIWTSQRLSPCIVHISNICPAVWRKTAGLFLSTKFYQAPHKQRKKYSFFNTNLIGAFALRQARLFFVKKCRFLTYYPSRAPPPVFSFLSTTKKHRRFNMIVKYDEFLSKIPGEVTEVEVDDELGKTMEQMALDDFNLDRKETAPPRLYVGAGGKKALHTR